MKTTLSVIIVIVLALAAWWFFSSQNSTDALSVTYVQERIVGTWQSTDDSKAVVVFADDGTTTNIYDGATLDSGTWEVFTKNDAEYDPSGVFLRTNVNDDEFEYSVWNASDTELTINYLARGNTLSYTRIEALSPEQ